MWWTLSALATTWNIPGQYPDIESAVLSGDVVDGDELLFAAGDHAGYHFEGATSPTDLTLRGVGPTSVIHMPATTSGAALKLKAGNWTVRDLTLDPQYSTRGLRLLPFASVDVIDVEIHSGFIDGAQVGGGVWIDDQGSLNADGLTITDCHADVGGAIAVMPGGSLTGTVDLQFNSASLGAGIYVGGMVDLEPGSRISDNTASEGGGVYVDGSFAATGTVIADNQASFGGGGIETNTDATLDLWFSTLTNNHAEVYGGGILGAGTWTIESTEFTENHAGQVGGAVYAYQVEAAFHNTSWCNNVGDAASGHGLFAEPSAITQIRNAYFGYNGATGGSTVFGPGAWDIANVLFHANPGPHALDTAGSLTLHRAVFDQSGLQATGFVDVTNNLFGPGAALSGNPTMSAQIFASPQIDASFGCQAYVGFPFATAPEILDQDPSELDLDGSPADLGHLGGPGLDLVFFGADGDNDASPIHVDCDDDEPNAFPGNTESCDGIDNDCDGIVDEAGLTVYHDADLDGYGAGTPHPGCVDGAHTDVPGDCDDNDDAVHPGADDNTCDGVDNDCDLSSDEDAPTSTWYADTDGDGFGTPSSAVTACASPANHVDNQSDCDDANDAVFLGATEVCNGIDEDCDGTADEGLPTTSWYLDDDGDHVGAGTATVACSAPGPAWVAVNGDCDDTDPSTYPDAQEQCDLIDHNCNGPVDDGVTQQSWYPDVDQDGFGAGTAVVSCAPVANHVLGDLDCGPTDPEIHPDADELCDLVDNDCDGMIDDADSAVTDATVWYADADDDSFGDPSVTLEQCAQPAGHVLRSDDCDDTRASVFTGAPEACVDHLDNDCDGLIDAEDPDYSFDPVAYGNDADDDGYGDPATTELACSGAQPLGYVPMIFGEDCNDVNSLVNPGQDEICDGLDNDCIAGPDSGLPFLDYFTDADGDLFGDPASNPVNACSRPPGRSGNALDCDDADASRNPLAPEVCNGTDDNCNFQIDDGVPVTDLYPDLDDDGYGDSDGTPESSCGSLPGYADDNTDCDDTDPNVNPGATEDPEDGIDSDCDGTVEQPPVPATDTDADGIPDPIDVNPLSAGASTTVEPPTPTYGCGCSATPAPGVLSGLGGLVFLGLVGLRHRR